MSRYRIDDPSFRGTLSVDRARGLVTVRERYQREELACTVPMALVAAMVRDKVMRQRAYELVRQKQVDRKVRSMARRAVAR